MWHELSCIFYFCIIINRLQEAFAVVREASKRVLGLRPFDVQLIGIYDQNLFFRIYIPSQIQPIIKLALSPITSFFIFMEVVCRSLVIALEKCI